MEERVPIKSFIFGLTSLVMIMPAFILLASTESCDNWYSLWRIAVATYAFPVFILGILGIIFGGITLGRKSKHKIVVAGLILSCISVAVAIFSFFLVSQQ